MIPSFAKRSPSKSGRQRLQCGLRRSNRIAAGLAQLFPGRRPDLWSWPSNSSMKSSESRP